MATRDSRIGELTNVATSIINQNTIDPSYQKMNDDNVSLLRIFQGKEIDYLKTGVRWQMNKGLRRYLKKLPYFLLYNYPKKLEAYKKTKQNNANKKDEDRYPLNAYKSPSPMNELCDYVETWEKKKFIWAKPALDTRCLIIDPDVKLVDESTRRLLKNEIGILARKLGEIIKENSGRERDEYKCFLDAAYHDSLQRMTDLVPERSVLANSVIDITYSQINGHQSIAWQLFGDVIIENLRKNTPRSRGTLIVEVPYKTDRSYEYLGKYYEMIEGV